MTKERMKQFHFLYGIFVSISIFISAVCLVCACLGIYHSGEQPFSRESVAKAFSAIAVPIYLCLTLVLLGFIFDLLFPNDKKILTTVRHYSLIRKRLLAQVDLNSSSESLRSAIFHQQKSRMMHKAITGALLGIGSVIFLIYCLNGSNYHGSKINDSMINAMIVLLPCMAVPFGYGVFAAYQTRTSIKKEIELLKQAPSTTGLQKNTTKTQNERSILILRCVLLGIGGAIMLYGLFTGGTADVLTKAINICTECVGLG